MVDEQHGEPVVDQRRGLRGRAPGSRSESRPAAGSSSSSSRGPGGQRPGDADQLALTLRELAGRRSASSPSPAASRASSTRRVGRPPGAQVGERSPAARPVGGDGRFSRDREVVEQLERLPGADRGPARARWWGASAVESVGRRSRPCPRRATKPVSASMTGRLARAVRADEADELARCSTARSTSATACTPPKRTSSAVDVEQRGHADAAHRDAVVVAAHGDAAPGRPAPRAPQPSPRVEARRRGRRG